MSLILVRHGETELNASRTLQPPQTPLSARGLAQAQAVARRLAAQPVAGLVSSDLPRAWRTAETIAARTGLQAARTPLLQERNFGLWRGRGYDDLDVDPLNTDVDPPDGESQAAFAERCRRAFRSVVALRAVLPGPLVVVTHGLVVRQFLAMVSPEGTALPRIGNTALTVLAAQAPHDIELLACTRHLDGDACDDARSLSGG